MLQISTGKFFAPGETYDTLHRGVLYSNFRMLGGDSITTEAGTLASAARWGDIETVVCEVIERQPQPRASGMIASVGPDTFISDFAAVASFCLQRLLTPDRDLATRLLTAQNPPLGIPKLARQYVSTIFEMSSAYDGQAGSRLSDFFTNLLKLERQSFSGAMRAIRRYVTAMYRLADDLDLAYALLVAAIESLTQGFDGFRPDWEDYEQTKRTKVDNALRGASADVAIAVRDAILEGEHTALSRRFRTFSLAHLNSDFFRSEAQGRLAPAGKFDLQVALTNAYIVRSKYVHTLKSIPRLLASPMALTDLMSIEGEPFLTFEGLARVARTVIAEFIRRAPTTEREEFAYMQDFPNLLTMQLAPSAWIHNDAGYDKDTAYLYLNGFLQQVEQALLVPGTPVTDIRTVTAKIEKMLPSLAKPTQRRPLSTLYYWFSHFLSPGERVESRRRMEKYFNELDTVCPEAFFLYVFEGRMPEWSPENSEEMFETYIEQRYKSKRMNAGALLGAAGALTVAEMYRQRGREDGARRLIARAVEEYPGIAQLREFEANWPPATPIDWQKILLSARPANAGRRNTLTKLNQRLRSIKRASSTRRRRAPETGGRKK